jgi:hypothetical protein
MSVRRSGPLALAAVLAAASCNKTVSQRPPAPTIVLATFNPGGAGVPAVIPLPNDLALEAAPSQTGLVRELLFSYINDGGFPGDQTITVPIRSENYDPNTGAYAPAAAPPAGIDATTVNAQTVAIVRVDVNPPQVLPPTLAAYDATAGVLRIRSVTGLPVGRYVVAVRGGDNGVKTSDGLRLGADQAIALIAPNRDLTQPENQPPVPLTPAQIASLEQLRALFAHGLDWGKVPSDPICRQALGIPAAAPFPEGECWLPPQAPSPGITAAFDAVDVVFPHHELASIQTFEIAAPAVVADTSAGVLPFPSDFLLDPATGKVRNLPSFGAAAPGLAQLDGFSTTSLDLIPVSGPVDAATIPGNVFLYELGAGAPRKLVPVGGAGGPPEYLLEPPSLVQNGQATAIGLQPAVPIPNGNSIVPLPPLKPKTRYFVVVTNGVKDPTGHAIVPGTLGRLLLTVTSPLTTAGHSNIPGVSDTDAAGLEQLRNAFRLQLLPAISGDLGGKQPVMAYTITTQDVKTVSANLTALPYNFEAATSSRFFVSSGVADFDPTTVTPVNPANVTHVKRFLTAIVASVNVLTTANGALDPTLATWTPLQYQANLVQLPVLVAVPAGLPSTCTSSAPCPVPLVVFHHGLNGSRFQMLGVADALAEKGFVVIATDAPFHGDRAFCAQNSDCAGGTCQLDPANMRAPGACVGGNGLAFDSQRLTTVASGNYFVSANFFRLRDAVREDLLDQSALILAAARPPGGTPEPLAAALAADGVAVNPTEVFYAGTSLGGIIGTSAVATNPRISRVAFNNAGGAMVDIFTSAPAFHSEIDALFAQLIPGFTTAKVTPGDPAYDPVVAQQYAQTLIVAKWVLDPAESLNWAADVTTKDAANATLRSALGPLAVPGAEVYGQFIQDDQVIPNPFNALLYLQNGAIRTTFYTTTIDVNQRHGVVYMQTPQGAVVRSDLANFLNDLTTPVTPVVALP